MRIERRISAVYKDLPGGQVLGPTYDYSHRLLDFTLLANGETPAAARDDQALAQRCPHVFSMMTREGLAAREEDDGSEPCDITRQPLGYPASRAARLQQLVRGDEGFLLALGYSTQRGYGRNHPFAGEIRTGYLSVSICPEELGFEIEIGEILLTECEMVNGFTTQGYSARTLPATMAWCSDAQSVRRWRWWTVRCRHPSIRSALPGRRRTKSSCCRTPITSKPPALSRT